MGPPSSVQIKLAEYPDYLMKHGYRDTWERLAAYLGVTTKTLDNYALKTGVKIVKTPDGEVETYNEEEDYASLLEPIRARLIANLVEDSLNGTVREAPGIFILKQGHYGGYTDRVAQDIDAKVTIEVDQTTKELAE